VRTYSSCVYTPTNYPVRNMKVVEAAVNNPFPGRNTKVLVFCNAAIWKTKVVDVEVDAPMTNKTASISSPKLAMEVNNLIQVVQVRNKKVPISHLQLPAEANNLIPVVPVRNTKVSVSYPKLVAEANNPILIDLVRYKKVGVSHKLVRNKKVGVSYTLVRNKKVGVSGTMVRNKRVFAKRLVVFLSVFRWRNIVSNIAAVSMVPTTDKVRWDYHNHVLVERMDRLNSNW